MSGYTKLFNSIVTSTIWQKDLATKVVWITLLALSDSDGYVEGSIPGLAHIAGVSIEECKRALEILEQPDEYSRTPDNEGRRIETIPGGWLILNRAKYRDMNWEEDKIERRHARNKRYYEKIKTPPVLTRLNPSELRHKKEKEEEKEKYITPCDSDEIIFEIAKAYPRLSHLRNETEIPRAVTDEIIRAIHVDGDRFVLAGTKAYAASLNDPKFAIKAWDFFHEFVYRQDHKPQQFGNARQSAAKKAMDEAFS